VQHSELLEIVPALADQVRFTSLDDLVGDVRAHGYYGGLRLLKATARRIADVAHELGRDVGDATFSITYETTIPRSVGLGGSSAIVAAAAVALCDFLGLEIDHADLPSLLLSVEAGELGIAAGPQDRVAQTFGGLTYMDFHPDALTDGGQPLYEPLDTSALPRLFVAWLPDAGEPSEVVHSEFDQRFESGDPAVLSAISALREHAARAREAALSGDAEGLGGAMSGSFEARRSITRLDARHVRLIEIATAHGAPTNYTGSGGAIVGIHRDAAHLAELEAVFAAEGVVLEECRPASGAAVDAAGSPVRQLG
jgi:glucuronokinase